jgi:excisionase family DNA binding protein
MALDSAAGWLTLADAAALLGVSRVTLYRWVKKGLLRTFRLGPRKIRVRQEDVDALFTPVKDWEKWTLPMVSEVVPKPLTAEEKAEQLRVIERLEAFREEVAAKRGGKPFSSSVPLIRRARAIRTRQMRDW